MMSLILGLMEVIPSRVIAPAMMIFGFPAAVAAFLLHADKRAGF